MSNALYEKFCRATFPKEMTLLDRHLLGHFCLRFNAKIIPARAFPGRQELIRITNVDERSVLRSLARLRKQGFLYNITPGKHRTRSEFGVNESLIEKFISVTEGSPLIDECPQGDESLTAGSGIGDSAVSNGSLVGHPISKESKTFDLVRFEYIMKGVPEGLRTLVNPGPNFEELLDELERKGTSQEAIREHLRANSWNGVEMPGGIVDSLLRQLLTIRSAKGETSTPIWCGECDETTRKVSYAWEYPRSGGGTTFYCPRCSKFGITFPELVQHSFN